jgi:excisionase family DNA binding protein
LGFALVRFWPLPSERNDMTNILTVTIPQACNMTGLGRSTMYRLFDEGKIPKLKVGNRTLIKVADLQAYIESLSELAA